MNVDINNLTVTSLVETEAHFHKPTDIRWARLPESASPPDSRKIKRILFINPPMTLYKHDFPRCTYPLGIGYMAGVLSKYEYDVKILDTYAEGYYDSVTIEDDNDFIRYGLSEEKIEKEIRDFDPQVVGVSGIFTNQADNIHKMLKIIKKVNSEIVTALGGSYPHYFPRACLSDQNLDLVVLGESELTFFQYIESLNGYFDIENISGIAYRKNGDIRVNPGLTLIGSQDAKTTLTDSELDNVPFPLWSHFNMEQYFKIRAYQSPYTKGDRVGQIYTSRGCKAHCTFCTTTNFWGNRFRSRSPQNVLDELILLKEKYGINEFHVQDDNITNNMEHAKHLFKVLEEISLPWATPQGIALWSLDEELLELMAASGAYQLTFAVESGSQRVLFDLIKKPLNLSKTKRLLAYAKKLGIHIHGFFIIGMPPMFGKPGETIEEMKETYRFAEEAGFDSASFFAVSPIIGSELLTECLRQGFINPGVKLFQMSYKQGLINVPDLWDGKQVAELAAKFNYEFNKNASRESSDVKWSEDKY